MDSAVSQLGNTAKAHRIGLLSIVQPDTLRTDLGQEPMHIQLTYKIRCLY